jgi:hypothetical protein
MRWRFRDNCLCRHILILHFRLRIAGSREISFSSFSSKCR